MGLVRADDRLRLLVFFFRGGALRAFFGLAVFRHFRGGIFAALFGQAFFTGFARFGLASRFFATFAREGGLSESQGGNDCGNCDITE